MNHEPLSRRYSVIYADPPWDYSGQLHDRGGTSAHYGTAAVREIAELPVASIAAWDCACLMWATYPKLEEALYVLRAWGFVYKTVAFTWVKMNPKSGTPFFGMGAWTRANSEICLLGIRGMMERKDKGVPQVVMSAVGEHSAKPHEVRDRIVRLLGDVPRIELYARPFAGMFRKPDGWDVWGNEVESDVDLATYYPVRADARLCA